MSTSLQGLLVAMIVSIASSYALLKFIPGAWRRRVAAGASRLAVRWGLSDADARRVEAKLASGGACGSCDSCKACATPPATTFKQIPIRRVNR